MTDMTIAAVRTTLLRVPWPDDPWLKGHAFGSMRNLLVLEVETKSDIVGMGYLHPFTPTARTIAACLEDAFIPRVIGKDATAVEAIWRDLWRARTRWRGGGLGGPWGGRFGPGGVRHRHDGNLGARHRPVGRGGQTRRPAPATAGGAPPFSDARFRARAVSRARGGRE